MEGRDRPPARSHCVDVALEDARIEHGARVTVQHETGETPATVAWLGGRFHQLRCERRLDAAPGDRLEVGGATGVVLDADARKHGPSNDVLIRLTRILRGLG